MNKLIDIVGRTFFAVDEDTPLVAIFLRSRSSDDDTVSQD